jgi:hypothetical protein
VSRITLYRVKVLKSLRDRVTVSILCYFYDTLGAVVKKFACMTSGAVVEYHYTA